MALVAGVLSYEKLGREEDPAFSIKTMLIVTASWPGATVAGDRSTQVTDRIEKEVQQVDSIDYTKSYTLPGKTTVFVEFKDTTDPKKLPNLFYQVRKHIDDIRDTFPTRHPGRHPVFNDEFGDVYGNIYGFTADGLTMRQLRDYVEGCAQRPCCTCPTSARPRSSGRRTRSIDLDFSPRKLAGLGHGHVKALIKTLQEQNAVKPSGVIQAGAEQISVRVSGLVHVGKGEPGGRSTCGSTTASSASPTSPTIRRGYRRSAAAGCSAYDGEPALALAIAMRKGGNLLDFGKALARPRCDALEARLPIGVGVHLVSDQPKHRQEGGGQLHRGPGRGGGHRPASSASSASASVPASSYRCRSPWCSPPSFILLDAHGHHPAAHLARRPDHRPRPPRRRRDDHGRDPWCRGSRPATTKRRGCDLRLHVDRLPDADRDAGDRSPASFPSASTAAPPANTPTRLFVVIAVALVVSWIVAVLFAPLIGVLMLPKTMNHREGG